MKPMALRSLVRSLGRADRATALLDQGLLAAARFAAMLVFARIMSTDLFGAFALAVSISFILNNIQRAVIVLPFIVSCQRPQDVARAVREWSWIDIATTAAVTAILAAGWAAGPSLAIESWVRIALGFSALAAPPLMLYTFLRRVAYQTGEHRAVVAMVLVHAATYAAGIVLAVLLREAEYLPFVALAAAPAAGALVGAAGLHRHWGLPPPGTWHSFRSSIGLSKWSFLGTLAASVYTSGMNIVVAGFLGAGGSAAFAAARTLVSPTVSLATANDMVDKPRAGRAYADHGLAGLRRSVRSALVFLGLLGGSYLLLVAIFSGPILDLVYGEKYAGLETELRLWALVMLLNLAVHPLATYLVTLRDTRSIFLCNLAAALVAVGVALPLFDSLGVAAALIAMGCARLANLALLWIAARHTGSAVGKGVPAATRADSGNAG